MDEMLKDLHELCEMYGDWIHEAKDKLRRSGTSVSPADADYLDKLTHSLKSIKTTVAMMESEDDEGGYSGRYMMPRYGYTYEGDNRGMSRSDGYGGMSNAGRMNAKRDSRGRYSRNGYSYAEDINGLVDEMRDMMDSLPEEKRREVERFVNKMDRM